MSRQALTQTTLTRTSQARRESDLLLAFAFPALVLCISPLTPSPIDRLFARRGAEDDRERTARFTHPLLLAPDLWQVSPNGSVTVRLHRHAERRRVLQRGVSIEPISPVFSLLALGHSLQCFTRALRHGASLLRLCRPTGYGFQKIFVQRTQKDFPELP